MTSRPLRVLQVVQRFYPELGGLETHVAEVTARLNARPDIDVTVLTTDRSGALPREDRINGVRVIRRRSWPRNRDYYLSPGLFQVIRKGGWDVVHLQGGQTFVPPVGMVAALCARIPYVLTFHSGGHSTAGRSRLGQIQTRILRPLLRRATRLIAVSRFEKKRFVAATGIDPGRFTVVNNGGALPPVASAVRPVSWTLVSSGRLEKYKGHHRVIEALPAILAVNPAARLTILGGGPYEDELHALADRLGVSDAVTIRHLPPTERARMAEILASTSVMAALSTYEAHPVGIMEAIAIGLPVVGCDVAGIGDLVEDGLIRGIGVDADADEVAAVLIGMLRDNENVGVRTPPSFTLPTWETCTSALAEIYHEVADPHRDRPLRVAQVITTLTTGGAERQLESLVAHSRNHHRTIALYDGGTVADAMRDNGAQVEVLGMSGVRKLLAIPRLALRLRRMRPDVAHVHLLSGQLWGIPAARLARVPIIVSTEHSLMDSSMENRPLTPTLRRIYRRLESMVTETIAVSTTTKSRLQRWQIAPERVSVIDNGIDFDSLAFSAAGRDRVRSELGIAAGTHVVGGLGRLEPVKRFPQLLAAIAPTLQVGVRELLLVGDGPLREPLRLEAERLGVADCVHLTGPRPDVRDLLSAMDVLVSPSRDETFGMAVLEGLAAGLPVVYAQCPALDELGEAPEWALALDPGDAAEAVSINELVDRVLDGGQHRHHLPPKLIEAYGIDGTAAAVDDLYRRLIARRTPHARRLNG